MTFVLIMWLFAFYRSVGGSQSVSILFIYNIQTLHAREAMGGKI